MLLDEGRRVMVRETKGASGISKTTMHHILTEYLMKKKIVAQWVLHMLFPTQKQRRMEQCYKHLTCYRKEGIVFLQRIIAIDET